MDVSSIDKNEIKMILSDVDGTLLDSSHNVHARNAAAILKLRQQHPNLPFVIATGKPFAATAHIRQALQLTNFPAIHINGCLVYDTTGRVTKDTRMAPKVALEIFEHNKPLGNALFMYSGDVVYEVLHDPTGLSGKSWLDCLRAYGEDVVPAPGPVESFLVKVASGEIGVQKMIVAVQLDRVKDTRKLLEETWPHDFHITQALPWAIELLPVTASKSEALKQLLPLYNLSPENVMAFGDGDNDASMLELVRYGVSMANAMETPKRVARFATLSNDEGGVGAALETIFGLSKD